MIERHEILNFRVWIVSLTSHDHPIKTEILVFTFPNPFNGFQC